jgi:hypothetical protein
MARRFMTERHFATVNCRIAKGLFDHLAGLAEQCERDGEGQVPWRP